jgi:NCS1 family nucleobase:cation symporter-1
MKWNELLEAIEVPRQGAETVSWWLNDDIIPLPLNRRTWTYKTYFSWWSIWLLGITNFQLGSSLVTAGLSIWQTMTVIVIGRILTALLAVLLGHVGGKWHISYPVYSRAVWGFYGSFTPIVLRIFSGLLGYAIQSWLGALNVTAILDAIFPTFYRMQNTLPAASKVTTKQLVGWVVFNVALAPGLLLAPERAKKPMAVSVIITFVTLFAMTTWSSVHSHGLGSLWTVNSALKSHGDVGWTMVSGITSVIGAIAPAIGMSSIVTSEELADIISVGQADFSRFSQRPRDQVYGQVFAFVVIGCVMPLFGCIMSSATQAIYGQAIWNPTALLEIWLSTTEYSSGARVATVFAGLGLVISQYSLSIADSAYSIGIDLSGIFPRFFTIRRGAYFGLVVSIAVCPWELLSSGTTFLAVINSLVVFFAGIMGILTADYWIVRSRRVQLNALYSPSPSNPYWYSGGFNHRSITAWICSFVPLLPGMIANINKSAHVTIGATRLYQLAFFWAFITAFLVYWLLTALFPIVGVQERGEDSAETSNR